MIRDVYSGSGSRVKKAPDPGSANMIRDVYSGSQICIFSIPDPGSKRHRIRNKEFKNFLLTKSKLSSCKYKIWCLFRIPDPKSGFCPSWSQGSKKHRTPDLDPQHWTQVCFTVIIARTWEFTPPLPSPCSVVFLLCHLFSHFLAVLYKTF